MPEATLDAVADHGVVRGNTIAGTYDESREVLAGLESLGIAYDDVIEVLEAEGVQKFEDSYAQLAESVAGQLDAAQ
jgi:transaldolase